MKSQPAYIYVTLFKTRFEQAIWIPICKQELYWSLSSYENAAHAHTPPGTFNGLRAQNLYINYTETEEAGGPVNRGWSLLCLSAAVPPKNDSQSKYKYMDGSQPKK